MNPSSGKHGTSSGGYDGRNRQSTGYRSSKTTNVQKDISAGIEGNHLPDGDNQVSVNTNTEKFLQASQ